MDKTGFSTTWKDGSSEISPLEVARRWESDDALIYFRVAGLNLEGFRAAGSLEGRVHPPGRHGSDLGNSG